MRVQLGWVLCSLVVWVGCGGQPTPEEVAAARTAAMQSVSGANLLMGVGDLLGLTATSTTCGEPRRTVLAHAAETFSRHLAGAACSIEPVDGGGERLVVALPPAGVRLGTRHFRGRLFVTYTEGEARTGVEAQSEGLTVDGVPVDVSVGYLSCGDQTEYAVRLEAQVAPDVMLHLDGVLAAQDGGRFEGETFILNGAGALIGPTGTDRVTLQNLTYPLGALGPREGDVLIETATGHSVHAVFRKGGALGLGTARLVIDGHSA